jgi:hypothetical protein
MPDDVNQQPSSSSSSIASSAASAASSSAASAAASHPDASPASPLHRFFGLGAGALATAIDDEMPAVRAAAVGTVL